MKVVHSLKLYNKREDYQKEAGNLQTQKKVMSRRWSLKKGNLTYSQQILPQY
jgi:hypothetical protein